MWRRPRLWLAGGAVGWVAFKLNDYVGAIAGAVVLTVAVVIYFRLLGRLAWYCADRASFAELEAQFAELDDEDFDEGNDDEEPLT